MLYIDVRVNAQKQRKNTPFAVDHTSSFPFRLAVRFGYKLDSGLLKDLAAEGQGCYSFVPDGSFVGTAFVNATSNILSTAARQVLREREKECARDR